MNLEDEADYLRDDIYELRSRTAAFSIGFSTFFISAISL